MAAWTEPFPEFDLLKLGQLVWVESENGSVSFEEPNFTDHNNGWSWGNTPCPPADAPLIYMGEACHYCTPRGKDEYDKCTYVKVVFENMTLWVPTFNLRDDKGAMEAGFARRPARTKRKRK